MKVALDYPICLSVHVDTETGLVEGINIGFVEFNVSLPEAISDEDAGYAELGEKHPDAETALKIVDRITQIERIDIESGDCLWKER